MWKELKRHKKQMGLQIEFRITLGQSFSIILYAKTEQAPWGKAGLQFCGVLLQNKIYTTIKQEIANWN